MLVPFFTFRSSLSSSDAHTILGVSPLSNPPSAPQIFRTSKFVGLIVLFASAASISASAQDSLLIGNFLRESPNGITWVVNNEAAFAVQPETHFIKGDYFYPGPAAPDGSYHKSLIPVDGSQITLEWGRVGDNVVGRITADKALEFPLHLSSGWPDWTSVFTPTKEGATALAHSADREIHWEFKASPVPASTTSDTLVLKVGPNAPVLFIAGIATDSLPAYSTVERTLSEASTRYLASRPQASGDWGDFVGAIADNVNNSRLYNSNNHALAHHVSRGWAKTPNGSPYFCWDSFLTANLAALDDPGTARTTFRTMLSAQTPDGLVPNFARWDLKGPMIGTLDRSQPPVGSWCAWKMHQRYPDDLDFLREIYPRLVLWHDWWPKNRDANGNGLLEWGSSSGLFSDAQYETGWDDNLHFQTALMVGKTMNCDAVDLSALWAMDAHYLALLADVLGHKEDAARFRTDEAGMQKRINERLWNSSLGLYCSRFWPDAKAGIEIPDSAWTQPFHAEFFGDEALLQPIGTAEVKLLSGKLQESPSWTTPPAKPWAARWSGSLLPPQTGDYFVAASGEHSVRVVVGGKELVAADQAKGPSRQVSGVVNLQGGQPVDITVESTQKAPKAVVKLSVEQLTPAGDQFLTRITPMNFYPLIAGCADAERAKSVMATLTDPKKFWGTYLIPTLAYDDPNWKQQNYWHGTIWGPVNYILWEGIKRYASPAQIDEYADRSVNLFMTNWNNARVCGENYLSSEGKQSSDPHYTWGALLNLIALESIVDVDDQGKIVLNGTLHQSLDLKNIPLLGKRYDVRVRPGLTTLLLAGKEVLTAKGEVVKGQPD